MNTNTTTNTTTKATTVQAAFGCRRQTRAQLTRARAALADMTPAERKRTERLAAKYGVTPEQVVINTRTIWRTPTGSSGDTCGLRKPTTAELAASWERLAAKYGVTVKQLRSMTADGLALMLAEASCKAAKGARA